MNCQHCNRAIPRSYPFCPHCGTARPPAPPAKPCRFTRLQKTIALALAIVLLFSLAGFTTNWFGLNGPAVQLTRAISKTIKETDHRVDIRVTTITPEYNEDWERVGTTKETASGTALLHLDPGKEELTFYLELENQDGEQEIYAIYEGYYITANEYRCYKEDIREDLQAFFDNYQRNQQLTKRMLRQGKIDWEALLGEDTYREAEAYIRFSKLNPCLLELAGSLNRTGWLKDNAGYRAKYAKGMKLHRFNLDVCEFLEEVLDIFQPALKDRDTYDDLQQQLTELDSTIGNARLDLTVGIASNRLSLLEIHTEKEGVGIHVSLEIPKQGSAKIDTDVLEQLLRDAKEF